MAANAQMNSSNNRKIEKWFNSPVVVFKSVTISIGEYLPDFERRSFNLPMPDSNLTCINPNLDIIVRKPYRDDPHLVPIGLVSKDYRLIPHREVLNVAIDALKANDIDPAQTISELSITQFGERMTMSTYLPEKYNFDPGDGHELAMRLECFNSVDGSCRFKVFMGWFRFVCSNGLVLGVKKSAFERRHLNSLTLDDLRSVLENGLSNIEEEKGQFRKWKGTSINPHDIVTWVNDDVRQKWGFKAATRAYHIARSGCDVKIKGTYKGEKPTTIPTERAERVPGAPKQIGNAYDLSQTLAWLAKERNDLQEQQEWREDIPGLINKLIDNE